MSQKKYVSLSKLQTFLENLKSTFASKTHTHKVSDLTDYTVDSALSSTSTNPVQNAVLDAEFNAISDAMNALDAAVDTKATANHGIYYGTCDSVSNAQIKTVTLKDDTGFSLEEGTVVIVKFKYSNSMPSPQMKVGTTEPILMRAYGSMPMSASQATNGWTVGAVQIFVYDGTNWVRDYWRNTTYVNEMLGHGYGTCDTEETTLEKVVVCSGYSIQEGGFLSVRFTNAVPALSTLTIGNYTKEVYYNGELIPDGIIRAGETATFVYDGEVFHLISVNRDAYSKADHNWVQIYDSGATTEQINSFANINISGYKKIMMAIKCVNDTTNASTTRYGSAIFKATNGTTYQFPVFNSMFFGSETTTASIGFFEFIDGWIVCPQVVRSIKYADFLTSTEGGTCTNMNNMGSGLMKCTNPLSTVTISNLDQNADFFFGVGSRVIIWGSVI